MSAQPLVSIAIPAYKSTYFETALRSACQQTYRPLEIVICDDNRTGAIGEVVKRFQASSTVPIRYVYNESARGELFNAIECVKRATGKYIKFLHDDDVLHPDCVAELVAAMESDPGIALASSRRQLINTYGQVVPDCLATAFPFSEDMLLDGQTLTAFLAHTPVNFIGEPSCVMCRREDVLSLGDQMMSINGRLINWLGDLAMHVKLLQKGNLAFLAKPLTYFRVSLEQGSQVGRDRPGVGRQGSEYFRLGLRELGLHGEGTDVSTVSVSTLGTRSFYRVDIIERMQRAHAKSLAVQEMRRWYVARVATPVQRRLIGDYLQSQTTVPTIGVIILDPQGQDDRLNATLLSLNGEQLRYPGVKACVLSPSEPVQAATDGLTFVEWQPADSVGQINRLIEAWAVDWVMLVQAGDEFTPSGLLMAGLELLPNPECRAIFGDGIFRQADGKVAVGLRPDFNLDYLLSYPSALARNWLFRRSVLLEAGGFAAEFTEAMEFELILRLIIQGGIEGFGHIPEPMLINSQPVMPNNPAEIEALRQHVHQRGYDHATVRSLNAGQYQIDYGHQHQPLVSMVLVIQDELAALQRCLISVLEHTRYPHYELVIVDNSSGSPDVQGWLLAIEEMLGNRLKVVRLQQAVDRSTANNMGAEQAEGEYLLLLQPSTAMFAADWLDALLNHALRQEVAIVGAKTFSGEGEISQAGLVLGLLGGAAPAFVGEPIAASGYMSRLQLDQNYSAVSDACLMIRKAVFDEVGGFNSHQFPDAGADVDLCLRVAGQGYLTVWTPRAMLMHSVTPAPMGQEAEEALYNRWLPALARDPAYNQNFSLALSGGFSIANAQAAWRPLIWRPLPVVLALPTPEQVGAQPRIIQPFEALTEAGLIDGALSDNWMNTPELERFAPDVIVLQRPFSADQLNALRRMQTYSRAFRVLEVEDYLLDLPAGSAHRYSLPGDLAEATRAAFACVDRVVVGTPALAEMFRGLHPDIRVVQSRLVPALWGTLSSTRQVAAKPRVGVKGSELEGDDLEIVADVIRMLANEVEWVCLGHCPEHLSGLFTELRGSPHPMRYPAALAALNLDLALAPRGEDLFSECKGNQTLLEFGACAIPVICSDAVGFRGNLPVKRVRNTTADWLAAVRLHLAEPQACAQLGDALCAVVRQEWMLEGEHLTAWRDAWLP